MFGINEGKGESLGEENDVKSVFFMTPTMSDDPGLKLPI